MADLITELTNLIVSRLEAAQALDQLGALAGRLQQEAERRSRPTRVVSAASLSIEQQATIRESLELGEVEFVVDPQILGGLILEHEGRRTDLSWRKRLEDKS